MIKLTKEQFIEYLENDCVINLTYKNEDYEIFKMYSYEEDGQRYFEGLFVDNDIVRNIDVVIRKFKIKEEVEVNSINDYEDYEAFLRNYALNNINMNGLLEIYQDADKFSLIMNVGEDNKFDYETLEKAYEHVISENKKALNVLYDLENLTEPFETIYQNIKEECLNFKKDFEDIYHDNFQYSFICDHVGDETKYYKPYQFFWQFYQTLGMELDLKQAQENYVGEEFDVKTILPETLSNNLIETNLTYYSYSSYGPLQLELYFKLNEETKDWLKQFENEFALDELGDLAFYQGDKQVFVSITHEQKHMDIR